MTRVIVNYTPAGEDIDAFFVDVHKSAYSLVQWVNICLLLEHQTRHPYQQYLVINIYCCKLYFRKVIIILVEELKYLVQVRSTLVRVQGGSLDMNVKDAHDVMDVVVHEAVEVT